MPARFALSNFGVRFAVDRATRFLGLAAPSHRPEKVTHRSKLPVRTRGKPQLRITQGQRELTLSERDYLRRTWIASFQFQCGLNCKLCVISNTADRMLKTTKPTRTAITTMITGGISWEIQPTVRSSSRS